MSDNLLSQLQQATSETQKTWIITEALLQTLPPSLAEAALAAAIPHWFNETILAALLQIKPIEAEPYYRGLQELSFSESFGNLGYALHDLTRAGILSHLVSNQQDRFKIYSQQAYEYFHQFDDPQYVVETTYHLLALDKADGMEKFKTQTKNYRREANFSAANNLTRNAKELVHLGLLAEEAAEIERQDFLNVEKLIRVGKQEAKPEYLAEAIKFLRPAEDLNFNNQVEPSSLHDLASNLKRNYLFQKLDEAQRLGDKSRQKIWLTEWGDVLGEEQDFEAALEHYNKALSLEPYDKEAIAHRGMTFRLMNRYEDALADLTHAVELDDKMAWAIAHRGATYLRLKRYDEALADFNRAIELDDKMAWAIAQRGLTFRLMNRHEDALADLSRAIELDKMTWIIYQRGLTFRLMDRYEDALADFNRAIELDDKMAWAITERGLIFRLMDRYDDALADFNRAIELDDKMAWATAQRGITYQRMNRYDDALADFNRAIELDDKMAWATAQRGITYQRMNRYDDALADFNRAIELDDKMAWAIAHRGASYLRLKRYDEALTDLTRAIELNDKDAWPIARRGETYLRLKRYDEALVDFNRAIVLAPDRDWSYYSRGLIYLTVTEVDQAQADLYQAIDLADRTYAEKPQDWINTLNLAVYHLAASHAETSERLYYQALTYPAPKSSLEMAVNDLDNFLQLFPNHLHAQAMRELLQQHLIAEN